MDKEISLCTLHSALCTLHLRFINMDKKNLKKYKPKILIGMVGSVIVALFMGLINITIVLAFITVAMCFVS
jgi:hypothetical protein